MNKEIIIVINCPTLIETYVDFACNITMLLSPRHGYTDHNLTITFVTNPTKVVNLIFNTETNEIINRIDVAGTYNIILHESNYNSTVNTAITVISSNYT